MRRGSGAVLENPYHPNKKNVRSDSQRLADAVVERWSEFSPAQVAQIRRCLGAPVEFFLAEKKLDDAIGRLKAELRNELLRREDPNVV